MVILNEMRWYEVCQDGTLCAAFDWMGIPSEIHIERDEESAQRTQPPANLDRRS
jgi:hypothetical protein